MSGWKDEAKKRVSEEAVKEIKDGYVVGLGSGSTMVYAMQEVGRLVKKGMSILGIPTSYQAMGLAVKHGVPLTTLAEHPEPDLAIDGADQVDPNLDMIKSTSMLWEKIVDGNAKRLLILVDSDKLTDVLGKGRKVPVEVVPYAIYPVMKRLEKMGLNPELLETTNKVGPLITDFGNCVIQISVPEIRNSGELQAKIKSIPGVVETGLFVGLADRVYVGYEDGSVKTLDRKTR